MAGRAVTEIRLTHDIDRLRQAIARAPGEINRAVGRGLRRSALVIQRRARANAPKATSELTQSILLRRPGPLQQLIQANAEHARAVEEGRDPGGPMPPTQSIRDWMTARGIATDAGEAQQERVAFLIARKIAREGTEAQPFMEPALTESSSELDRIMRDSVEVGVRRALE